MDDVTARDCMVAFGRTYRSIEAAYGHGRVFGLGHAMVWVWWVCPLWSHRCSGRVGKERGSIRGAYHIS